MGSMAIESNRPRIEKTGKTVRDRCRRPLGQIRLLVLLVVAVVSAGCNPSASDTLDWAEVDALIDARFPEVPSVTTEALQAALAEGRPVVLLDAREADEFTVSHLFGAHHATTVEEAEAVLAAVDPDGDALVVAYCSVGYRSAALVEELRQRGTTNAVNLEGSIFAWANEDRPVYRDGSEVEQVHPFDDSWGTLLDPALWAFEPAAAVP